MSDIDVNGIIRELDLCILMYGSQEGLNILYKVFAYLKERQKPTINLFPSLDIYKRPPK